MRRRAKLGWIACEKCKTLGLRGYRAVVVPAAVALVTAVAVAAAVAVAESHAARVKYTGLCCLLLFDPHSDAGANMDDVPKLLGWIALVGCEASLPIVRLRLWPGAQGCGGQHGGCRASPSGSAPGADSGDAVAGMV